MQTRRGRRVRHLWLYSDGGSVNNGGKNKDKPVYGAYCSLIVNGKNNIQKKFCNVEKDVTNNQMELKGFIEGFKFLAKFMKNKYPEDILDLTVISDSQYLIKGCSEWMAGWKRRGWKNSAKKEVENIDMWKEIDSLINENSNNICITFQWTRGHKGKSIALEDDRDSYFNEKCDTILSEALSIYR